MKLLTYVAPQFSQWQLQQLADLKSEACFQYLSNAFRLNQMNFSKDNLARPKSRQVTATAVYMDLR